MEGPFCFFFFFFFFFFFLGLHLRHMEVPRLGVELELRLLAYTAATATWDLSHTCDLPHNSWQRRVLNPLSEVRDRAHILLDTSRVLNLLSHHRNSCPSVSEAEHYFCIFYQNTLTS